MGRGAEVGGKMNYLHLSSANTNNLSSQYSNSRRFVTERLRLKWKLITTFKRELFLKESR